MLARGELQTIGATTLDEYRKYIEKDSALERRFQPIQVAEPTLAHAIEILKGLRDRYEAHHRVSITDARPGGRGQPGRPLHQRPLPAGQGDRPDRRGRRATAHPPHDRAAGPARVRREDRRRAPREGVGDRRAGLREGRPPARRREEAARPEGRAREAVEVRRHGRRRRGRRGADRRGAGRRDRHPGVQADRGGVLAAAAHGGRAAQAHRRPGRRHQGAVPGDPPHPRRSEGPAAPGWVVHLRRPHRCR